MSKQQNVRPAAVAGSFYPADSQKLSEDIGEYLSKVSTSSSERPRAIIVPHAGYFYSAQTAAYAYRQLAGFEYERIIIIGNAHTEAFPGIAVDDHAAWETPLGKVELDKKFIDSLIADSDFIKYRPSAHARDHALEVQIPFLQTVLLPAVGFSPYQGETEEGFLLNDSDPTPTLPLVRGGRRNKEGEFKIIPLLFGNVNNDYQKLAEVLAKNLGADDLVVISSDLSHYPKAGDSKLIDTESLKLIQSGNINALEKHIRESESMIMGEETAMCGADAVKLLMRLSELKNWQGEILHYSNSGHVGDPTRVVGYGAMIFTNSSETKSSFTEKQKKELLNLARNTIEEFVRTGKVMNIPHDDERFESEEGAFVTLHRDGKLRGCIGNIISNQSLWDTIQDMAVAAATEDSRFMPVTETELSSLEYEISVLSKPSRIKNWQDIKLGVHGVIIRKGMRSGVFLPQVATETGWDLETFLLHLSSEKAGLPADAYKNDPDVVIEVFTAEVF